MTDSTVTADREQLFAKLADPATTGKFFERVSDSVSWTVMGTHPLAGTYTSKQAFFDSDFDADAVTRARGPNHGRTVFRPTDPVQRPLQPAPQYRLHPARYAGRQEGQEPVRRDH
jgi:hypothetical protein